MEQCDICGKEVQGELGVLDLSTQAVTYIAIVEMSKRNWILCDACNTLVCHACCTQPKTGYCDACIEQYGLKFDKNDNLTD